MKYDLHDLDLLAKHWPAIFGRSLDPSSILGVRGLQQPEPNEHQSTELQAALCGLQRLYEMSESPTLRRYAEVLLYARVTCGPIARSSGQVYLTIAQTYSKKRTARLTKAQQQALLARGLRLYHQACQAYQRAGAGPE